MAVRAAVANGNLTSSSTWATTDSTSYSNSESANTALTTSQVSSSTFTPGAITIDGIGVKIASRAASPTGTMTVQLTQAGTLVTGTNVTVNVSDLPTCTATSGSTTPVGTAEGGWFFFKFSSPVTLLAATAYAVSAATSSSSQVNLWSAATTNWSRYLRTTTTGSPVAADDLIITGEWTAAATVTARTVTMDSTSATAYGSNTTSQVTPSLSICNNGTLTFGAVASTNYILQQAGHVVVYNGGTLNVGTLATPIPRNSTATLQFNCTGAGDFGVVARNGSTVNMYGLSRTSSNNTVITTLAANYTAGGTSLTTAVSTGWLSGDVAILASSAQGSGQWELATLSANASGTTLTVAALSNNHSGTAPVACSIGLVTHNVLYKSTTGGNAYSFFFAGNTSTVNLSWVAFTALSVNVAGKRGIEIQTTNANGFNADSCSFYSFGSQWVTLVGAAYNGISFTNCVFTNAGIVSNSINGIYASQATSGTWTFSNCQMTGMNTNNSNVIGLGDLHGTITNSDISGATGSGYGINMFVTAAISGTISGNVVHSNSSGGLLIGNATSGSISTCQFYRNSGPGLNLGVCPVGLPVVATSCNFFGNSGYNVYFSGGGQYIATFDTCAMNGDTTYGTGDNFHFASSNTTGSGGQVYLYNCALSQASGILTAATNEFNFNGGVNQFLFIADKTSFGAATLVTGNNGQPNLPWLQATNFNGAANDSRTYISCGISGSSALIQTNTTTVYSTNTRSAQLTPKTAAFKLQSSLIYVAVQSGQVATPTVQVQKNSSYNGNAPRLIQARSDSMGVTADTVVATFSAAANTWQGLSGASGAAPQDGVYVYYVDCDGTAGSIFVGNATATVA
jgi:hypothetical protein